MNSLANYHVAQLFLHLHFTKMIDYRRDHDHEPTSVFIETYGCQMNVNDTEIVQAILLGHMKPKTKDDSGQINAVLKTRQSFTLTDTASDADVVGPLLSFRIVLHE